MLLLLLFAVSWAQRKITGEVLDQASGGPVIGATVQASKTLGTSTNAEGKFTLTVPEETKSLTVSFIGYKAQTITLGASNDYKISIAVDDRSLDQVVVVGYGTQKRANLTGAVSTVDVAKTMQARTVTDAGRAMQGTVPGLTITTVSGDLGTNPSIRLRGMTGSTNASGGAQPLILLDNVEIQSLLMVNPDDIESISVLKDAASTSIYGSRAAYGVVLITSKTGKKNTQNRVSYSNNIAWSKPTSLPDVTDDDGLTYALLARQREAPGAKFFGHIGSRVDSLSIERVKQWKQQYGGQDLGPEMVEGRDYEIRDGALFYFRPWDVNKLFIRSWTPQQNHNLNFTGGNDKTTYNLSLGFLNQEGLMNVKTDKFQRANVNLTVNTAVTSWLDLRSRVMMARTDQKTPFSFQNTQFDPLYYLYRWHSIHPYGTIDGKPVRNVVSEMQAAQMSGTKVNYNRYALGGTFKIIPGLTLDADYTYTNQQARVREVGGPLTAWNLWSGVPLRYETYTTTYDYAQYLNRAYENHTFKTFATYQKDISDHSIKVMAGMDAETQENNYALTRRNGVIDPNVGEPNLANGDQIVGSSHDDWATMGFFGRINYAFKNRYLLELNGRYDGSSNFPAHDQWGFFPSASAGYIITEEEFMSGIKNVLPYFKLRASYGSIGNSDVTLGNATFRPSITTAVSNWWIGSANMLSTNANSPRIVPPLWKWETINTLDFGFDSRFWKERIGLTFDWYRRTTKDMVSAGVELPSTFGGSAPPRNYGELQTTGWEISIDGNHTFDNELSINATLSLSDFREKLTKFSGSAITGNYQGKYIGEIWGYETDRLFTEDDFQRDGNGKLITDATGKYILKEGVASQKYLEGLGAAWFWYGPGDVKFKDLNGDSVVNNGRNSITDHGDMRVIGNSTPRYQYGIRLGANWKGVDFNIFFQGVGKRELWAPSMMTIPSFRPYDAVYEHQMDYWTPTNTDAFYPKPSVTTEAANQNFFPQTRYLLDMSYLRLKNVSLGYTLPKSLAEKARLQSLRVYVSGENLWEKDNLHVPIDPEVDYRYSGISTATFGRNYPYRRSFAFGLQVTL
ncbi:TonB-dependent receptor [Chitinophaga horti]|uniref:TonB-dependent receptor n=1 Tax=Chitinophaga horti TaxID=2920382 RepID=A0ABY6J4L7_9BACT|nr:TonB-dependent receptor [Chitinophaga horti]UYQ94613.1 TonB-dependent receptor [Chitinophaga horti]